MLKSKKLLSGISLFLVLVFAMSVTAFAREQWTGIINLPGMATVEGWLQVIQPSGPDTRRRAVNASTRFEGGGPHHNGTIVRVGVDIFDVANNRLIDSANGQPVTWTVLVGIAQPRVSRPSITASSDRGVRAIGFHSVQGPVTWNQRTEVIR